MSDPVSNAEIEDVLSSIRRLVSVDSRAEPRKEAEPSADRRQTDSDDKDAPAETGSVAKDTLPQEEARLVLTPSFRVNPVQDEASSAPAEKEGDDSDHLTLGQWQVDAEQSEDTDEALDDASGPDASDDRDAWRAEEAEDPEPDLAAEQRDEADTDQAEVRDDDVQFGEQPEEAEDQDASDEAEDAALASRLDEDTETELAAFADEEDAGFEFVEPVEDEDEAEAEAEEETTTSELEARIAEVEAAVAAREDQWEPDGESVDAYAGGKTEPLPWEDHVEEAEVSEAASEEEDEMSGPSSDATDAYEADTYHDADEGEADEAVETVDELAEHFEPKDEPEPKMQQDRFSAAAPKAAASREDTWYSEDTDAVLDEDALRDLVSEIVRQELQGTLGERITRNVRKLVRREIHRAMMGQDFE